MKIQKIINVSMSGSELPHPVKVVAADSSIQLVLRYIDFLIPDGTTATLFVRKPSGKFVYQTKNVVVTDKTVTIDLDNQAIIERGKAGFTVTLKNGTDTLSTFANHFDIDRNYKDSSAEESRTVMTGFEEMLEEFRSAVEEKVTDEALKKAVESYMLENPIIGGNVSNEEIVQAVENYLEKNPIQAGATAEQEQQIAKNTQDISELSGQISDLGVVPQAVVDGVSSLVDKALSREGNRIFRFLISADAHQKNDHELITRGTKELGQAHGEVLKLISVDFVGNLGDITWGSSSSDNATVLEEGKAFNRFMLDSIRGETQIWTEGNHETASLTDSQIYGLIYSHNKGLVQDAEHWIEGYGYMDFHNQKVRVICLNTDQATGNDESGVSDEQVKWFAETALNMEGKTDWSVITMAHHPIDYWNITMYKNCTWVLDAFISGKSLDFTTNGGTNIAVNYNGKNCQYVGHFHGHAHAYSVVKMQKRLDTGDYEKLDAWVIGIPNACYERNNQYKDNGTYAERYATEITYNKSDEDGKRTSFNLVTVLLDEKMIYADNYGAGIDRMISYAEEPLQTFTIARNLTNCVSSSTVTEVVENGSHTETLSPNNGYTMDGATVTVTMNGVDVTSSVYADGTINLANITGNIVITANAVEIVNEPVNLFDVSNREYTALTGANYVENNETRDVDYTKCYAIYSDGRRGSYPSSKITKCEFSEDTNGFTYNVSSSSGYGLEFPIAVEGGKTYKFKYTPKSTDVNVILMKFNSDTTLNGATRIHEANTNIAEYKMTINPETGYLYSLGFYRQVGSTDITLYNISLLEV